jgi:hypothetical protein
VDRLLSHCQDVGVTNVGDLLRAFGTLGLRVDWVVDGDGTSDGDPPNALRVSSEESDHLMLALKLFVQRCRAYATAEKLPPEVFYRVDVRIMRQVQGKVRFPPYTVDDVVPYLAPGDAHVLREVSDHVLSLGYRLRIKRVDLIEGTWRARYVGTRTGKTLFGFGYDRRGLNLRITCDETERILPHIAQCPPRVQEAFYAQCQCSQCKEGGCGRSIWASWEKDEDEIEMCYFAIFRVWEWDEQDVEAIKWLLGVQAGYLAR